MLTLENIKNNLIFLDRVELKGFEAMAMSELQMKLKAMSAELSKSETPEPDEE